MRERRATQLHEVPANDVELTNTLQNLMVNQEYTAIQAVKGLAQDKRMKFSFKHACVANDEVHDSTTTLVKADVLLRCWRMMESDELRALKASNSMSGHGTSACRLVHQSPGST